MKKQNRVGIAKPLLRSCPPLALSLQHAVVNEPASVRVHIGDGDPWGSPAGWARPLCPLWAPEHMGPMGPPAEMDSAQGLELEHDPLAGGQETEPHTSFSVPLAGCSFRCVVILLTATEG